MQPLSDLFDGYDSAWWKRRQELSKKLGKSLGLDEQTAGMLSNAMRPAPPNRVLIDSLPLNSLERLKLEVQANIANSIGISRAWDIVNHEVKSYYLEAGWDRVVKGDASTVIAGEIAKSMKMAQGFLGRAMRDMASSGDFSRLPVIARNMGPLFFTYMRNFPEAMAALRILSDKAGKTSTLEQAAQTGLSRREFGKIGAGAVGAPLVKMKAKGAIDKMADVLRSEYPGMDIKVEEVPGKEVTYDYYTVRSGDNARTASYATAEAAEKGAEAKRKFLLDAAKNEDRQAEWYEKTFGKDNPTYRGLTWKARRDAVDARSEASKIYVREESEVWRGDSDAAIQWDARPYYSGQERPGSRKDIKLVKITVKKETPYTLETTDSVTGKEKRVRRESDNAILDVTPEEALDPREFKRSAIARRNYKDVEVLERMEEQENYSDIDSEDGPVSQWLDWNWEGRVESAALGIEWHDSNIWAKRMQMQHDYITQRIEDLKSGKVKPGEPTAPAEVQRTVNTEAPSKQIAAPGVPAEAKEAPPSAPPKAAAVTGSTAAPKASRRDWFRKLIPGTETPPKVETQAAGKSPFGSERGSITISRRPSPTNAWLVGGKKWEVLRPNESHNEAAERLFDLPDVSAAIRAGHVRVSNPHVVTALQGVELDGQIKKLILDGKISGGFEHPEVVVERYPLKGGLSNVTFDLYDSVSGSPIKKGMSIYEYSYWRNSGVGAPNTEPPPKKR